MDTCILCKSNEKDDVQYGEYLKNNTFGVHTFCLYLSSGLPQNGADDNGFLGFLPADIKRESHRVSALNCVYCHKKYANIGCCETKCRRTFHLICGIKNACENRFCHDFSSYCQKHIHRVKERPSAKETCLICFDSLWTNTKQFNAINMIQTPCCRNGWFHKLCLQKFANTSGYFFKCPLCNDAKEFRAKLPARGIFIPDQDAAWELEPNAFAELLERPSECSALQCKYRRGRTSENSDNPFILCSTCGSTAMHKQCLPNKGNRFHCADCTIAREEADSGRESVNSHGNDEEIDVCNVSDKEDLRIKQASIDNANNIETEKSKDKARDSGLTADQEEKHRQMSDGKVGRSEETPKQNEKPGHSKNYRMKLYKKPLRIISDSSSEEEDEEKVPIKLSLLKKHSTSKDEVIVTKPGYKRTFISDCDTDILENRPSTSKNCKKSNLLNEDSDDVANNEVNNKSIIISLDSSEDNSDDPIENFEEIMEKRKNMSCIALRTRRRSHDKAINSLPIKESSTNQLNNMKTTTNEQCFKRPLNVKTTKQPENIPANSKTCTEAIQKPKEADKKSKSSSFKPLKDETNTKASNELDISCIAKRTRRKSMGSCKSSKTIKNKENRTEENAKSLANVSCIAVRTRRRTICAQSAKEHFQMSQVYEKIKDSSTEKSRPICAQSAKEQFQMSQVYEKIQDSSTEESDNELENILEEDEKENTESDSEKEDDIINDSKFLDTYEKMDEFVDISCIAKRTRRRKSLTTKLQAIDDTDDTTCSSTTSTSTSSTLTSPSQIFQRNTRNRKSSANRLQLIYDTDDEEEKTCTASSRSSYTSTTTSSSDSLKAVKLNKRCSKRTLSASSEESSSTSPSSSSYESHCTSKTNISPSYLCEKFPQQNYVAFFNRRLLSSKSATNTAHNYYPNNQYHPHSNNRRRF